MRLGQLSLWIFPIVILTPPPLAHTIPSLSSTELLELSPVVVCGSLHLLLPIIGK